MQYLKCLDWLQKTYLKYSALERDIPFKTQNGNIILWQASILIVLFENRPRITENFSQIV